MNPFVASALDAAGVFAPGAQRSNRRAHGRATNAAVAGTSVSA